MKKLSRVLTILFVSIWTGSFAKASFEIEGFLTDNDGNAISGTYRLWVEIQKDGDPNCVLYREVFPNVSVDVTGSFIVTVGSGNPTAPAFGSVLVDHVLKNEITQQCYKRDGSANGSYVPSAGAVRSLSVEFELSPDQIIPVGTMTLGAVPYALMANEATKAKQLDQHTVGSLLRVEDSGSPQAVSALNSNEAIELFKLVKGQSDLYVRMNGGVATLPSFGGIPSQPQAGAIWFDTSENKIKFYDGLQAIALSGGGGGGGVSSVTSGDAFINVDNTDSANPKVSLSIAQVETQLSSSFASINDPRFDEAVKKSGDTMWGALELPLDGLKVGSNQLVAAGEKIGIGTDSPSVLLDVAGTVKIGDGGEDCSIADHGGMIRYVGGNLQFCNGSTWQTLGVSGAGLQSLNGQTGSTQELKVEITGTEPKFTSASDVHTLELPLASSAGVTAGLISNSDYESFSSKLTATLAAGHIFIGDGDNKATAVAVSGDVSITQTGEITVERLQGRDIDVASPVAGQVLKYDDDNNAWAPSYLTVSDLRSGLGGIGAPQFPSSCSKSETLTWNAITDQFVCQSIEISSNQVTDLGTMARKDADDYLTKDGNLAGLADPDAALVNLGATETGIALVKAQNAAEARAAIGAMENVQSGATGNVLQSDGTKWVSAPLSISASNFSAQQPNHVLAGPTSGGSGVPTFRALVAEDIPNLPASKITSGILHLNVMPAFSGDIVTNSGNTSAVVIGLRGKPISTVEPMNGYVLKWNGAQWTPAPDEASGIGIASIQTQHLADNAVTDAKIASVSAGKLLGKLSETQLPESVILNGGNDGAVTIGAYSESGISDISFVNNGDINMVLRSNGFVGIGTTTPSDRLHVQGNIVSSDAIFAQVFNYTSDRRLKTDIRPVEQPLDKVLQLSGVNFKWKNSGEEDLGFIAQDVERVLPEVVGTRKDAGLGEIKTVRYGNITALLIEAMKEFWREFKKSESEKDAEISRLKERLNEKDAENRHLLKRLGDLEERLQALESKTCGQ